MWFISSSPVVKPAMQMHQVKAMQETKVILEHPPTGIQLYMGDGLSGLRWGILAMAAAQVSEYARYVGRNSSSSSWLVPWGAQCHWKCPEPQELTDTLQEARRKNSACLHPRKSMFCTHISYMSLRFHVHNHYLYDLGQAFALSESWFPCLQVGYNNRKLRLSLEIT